MCPAVSDDNLAGLLHERLSPDVLGVLGTIARAAGERRERVYLVGGTVRDLLLGHETLDLDLAVEGSPDVSGLARTVADEIGSSVVAHSRFGTATLQAGTLSVDLAMARTERYPRPGALPEVQPGAIEEDLSRRDFTINAIAIDVSEPTFGAVIDPLAGRADLEARLIRVLHDGSFRDDPTRILRALRYQARFDFALEKHTERLLKRHAEDLRGISGDRVRHELERTWEEREPERVLEAAQEAGVLAAIHPGLAWDSTASRRFARARRDGAASPAVYLALFAYELDEAAVNGLVKRLALSRAAARAIRDAHGLRGAVASIAAPQQTRPSEVVQALDGYSPDAVAACRAATESPIIDERLGRYLKEWRDVRPQMDGKSLAGLGVDEGPDVGALLERLRNARLDGQAVTRDDEVALVRRWLRSSGNAG